MCAGSLARDATVLGNLGRCDASNRTDCGYSGINQQQCVAKGCCWVSGPSPNPNK
jgi:hypothetical protein